MPPIARKLLVPVVILLALGLFAAAGFMAADPDEPLVGSRALEQLFPARDAEILRQGLVGVDLAPGWAGRLRIDGVAIPPDQLEQDNGLNQILFEPDEGKVIEQLSPQENCAEITYWQVAEGADRAGPPLRWCFRVS
ncbi:MAG: hypothetical protein GEV08_23410 [Acidimicrobiia bacterium]|nr:hypothetical protein [Acidimicrobiia bacterium]